MNDSEPTKPTALQRGQLRRRLRHQQRIREALLLDLGALVFELHRQGRREPELLQAKAAEVRAVDTEVRALAAALDADPTVKMLSPGVEAACANCGTLLSSADRFCPNCGTPKDPALAGGDEPAEEVEASGNGAGEVADAETETLSAPRPRPPWETAQAEEEGRSPS